LGRYTIAWYIGIAEAVFTSCIVLAVLFQHVSRLYRRLLDIASIDALTGLDNRRTLDSDIAAVAGSRRKTQGAALLLIDLDNFKQYNDRYGNVAGDDALRTVAAVLRSSIYRTSDAVARYGGEKFAVLLRDTELEGARAVAERVRRNVETTVLRIGARSSNITASIGVAYVKNTASYSSAGLLAAADRALYNAKDEGRNCVYVDGGPADDERRSASSPSAAHRVHL
jgi:diguanylate cyclase (GGDEF)-like protein